MKISFNATKTGEFKSLLNLKHAHLPVCDRGKNKLLEQDGHRQINVMKSQIHITQRGKFVLHKQDIEHAIFMSSFIFSIKFHKS